MNTLTYGVTEEFHRLGSNVRISYGIAAYADAEVNGTNTIVASVYDVSADRRPLDRLVQWCNLLNLSPTHLREVIDDFLAT